MNLLVDEPAGLDHPKAPKTLNIDPYKARVALQTLLSWTEDEARKWENLVLELVDVRHAEFAATRAGAARSFRAVVQQVIDEAYYR